MTSQHHFILDMTEQATILGLDSVVENGYFCLCDEGGNISYNEIHKLLHRVSYSNDDIFVSSGEKGIIFEYCPDW